MPYNKKAFGIAVSRLRVQQNLTQKQLADSAGIARSHLVTLENGEKTARLDTVWQIADALCIKPSDLIREVEEEIKNHKDSCS